MVALREEVRDSATVRRLLAPFHATPRPNAYAKWRAAHHPCAERKRAPCPAGRALGPGGARRPRLPAVEELAPDDPRYTPARQIAAELDEVRVHESVARR